MGKIIEGKKPGVVRRTSFHEMGVGAYIFQIYDDFGDTVPHDILVHAENFVDAWKKCVEKINTMKDEIFWETVDMISFYMFIPQENIDEYGLTDKKLSEGI